MELPSFKDIMNHPLWFIAFVVAGGIYLYIENVLPEKEKGNIQQLEIQLANNKLVLDREITIAQLKLIIETQRSNDLDLLQPLLQWVVNRQPVPAWVKYLDEATGRYEILVINTKYARRYGACYPYRGKIATELFARCRPKLTDEQLEQMEQYQINDSLAFNSEAECTTFREVVFPVGVGRVYRNFRKCPIDADGLILVYGELYEN